MWGGVCKRVGTGALVMASVLCAPSSDAGPVIDTGYNSYGYPGLIDMPVATSRPDGELSLTASSFAGQTRTTLTFQITPRLSGSFRYAKQDKILAGGKANYDRSFSLHYRFVDESGMRPAVAVGLNDFLGTGIYSSEYVVATKTVGGRLRFSLGMGWGRLATSGGFKNPLSILSSKFETRPPVSFGKGGTVSSANFFRGDAALFGGIEWQVSDRLRLTAEYSSDAYPRETPAAFTAKSQLNFGATYKLRPHLDLSLRYLYGSEFGLQLTAALNPKEPPNSPGREPAPPPVLARQSAAALSWPASVSAEHDLRARLREMLKTQGIRLHGFELAPGQARIEIENTTYLHEAQAVGRTARVLTRLMPAQVDAFVIVSVSGGVAVSQIVIRRADMELLEHDLDGSWKSFARARISSPLGQGQPAPERYPRFSWKLKPYFSPSYFDPDSPVRADFGADLSAQFEPARGLVVSGAVRQKIFGNLDDSKRPSNSLLPHVRSDFNLYDKQGDTELSHLTAAYYFKPGRDLYGRLTAGYLERMFGGVSAEMLWARNDSPFALGIEVNYVKQRDFDSGFDFRSYEVATGHVSAYWDMGNGFTTQLDAGRYLAGDWGATLTVTREFNNGWSIGAFATLTDVPFSTFGEGSFDKGIRISIPISWLMGEPNQTRYTTTIRPVTRDGGARLNVGGRLYERVRPLQKPALQDGWGRFWR
ncbi:MAG: YjbH domain-containing protein [Roseovarius sp.]